MKIEDTVDRNSTYSTTLNGRPALTSEPYVLSWKDMHLKSLTVKYGVHRDHRDWIDRCYIEPLTFWFFMLRFHVKRLLEIVKSGF